MLLHVPPILSFLRWLVRSSASRASRGPQKIRLGTIPLLPFVRLPYSLAPAAVNAHLHVMGLTGMGKSKLLAQYATQLILAGRSCAVIDPHTDLAHDVLRLLLAHGFFRRPDAARRVRYVDFADPARFVPFNVLRQPHYSTYETARSLVEACTRAWPALAGGAAPQFENLLLAAATVLIENGLPLTALGRLLTDPPYREALLAGVSDQEVVAFFRTRYSSSRRGGGGGGGTLNESTLRRAFLLTYAPALRYSLGQRENILDLRRLMDEQVSVIVNLGGLDAQTQRLLGCLLTVGFEVAALSRADLPEAARTPYHLIVDEFSQFAAQSETALARVLALARKYGLYLVLAHQTWGQIARPLRSALQNTALLTFRLGRDDAAWAATRIGQLDPYRVKYVTRTHPVFVSQAEQRAQWEQQLEQLRAREALLRLQERTIKFTTVSFPPPSAERERGLRHLLMYYAEHLLMPRAQVEALLACPAGPAASAGSEKSDGPAGGAASPPASPPAGSPVVPIGPRATTAHMAPPAPRTPWQGLASSPSRGTTTRQRVTPLLPTDPTIAPVVPYAPNAPAMPAHGASSGSVEGPYGTKDRSTGIHVL